jgi:hypothetical protein
VDLLTHPFVAALWISLLLAVTRGLTHKVIRKTEWRRSDFYLGVPLLLSVLTSSLVFVADTADQLGRTGTTMSTGSASEKLAAVAWIVALCLPLLLLAISCHQDLDQDLDDRPDLKKKQTIVLGGLMNTTGVIVLAALLYVLRWHR